MTVKFSKTLKAKKHYCGDGYSARLVSGPSHSYDICSLCGHLYFGEDN